MYKENTYQSILQQLSDLPVDYLPQINIYLQELINEIKKKPANRSKIMDFAGAWSDFPEEEFQDLLRFTQKNRNSLFDRNSGL